MNGLSFSMAYPRLAPTAIGRSVALATANPSHATNNNDKPRAKTYECKAFVVATPRPRSLAQDDYRHAQIGICEERSQADSRRKACGLTLATSFNEVIL